MTEQGFRAGAYIEAIGDTGTYMVLCTRCRKHIGTMRPAQILEAIWATKDRGGVLCPECREQTCDFCGVRSAWLSTLHQEYPGIDLGKGKDKICWTCLLDLSLDQVQEDALPF